MSTLTSKRPASKLTNRDGYFRQGHVDAAELNTTALLVVDLRKLGLTKDQGQKLEEAVRDFVTDKLQEMGHDLSKRSAFDLSASVIGFAMD
jgi:hypothetical protein